MGNERPGDFAHDGETETMTKTLDADIREALKPDAPELAKDVKANLAEITAKLTQSGAIDTTQPAAPTDPMETGITHLRTIDPDAHRAWSVKGPKGAGGSISLVYVDDKPVILHQKASGKFTVFAPM